MTSNVIWGGWRNSFFSTQWSNYTLLRGVVRIASVVGMQYRRGWDRYSLFSLGSLLITAAGVER